MSQSEQTALVYIGSAEPYFTLSDERNGYAETRRHLAGYSDSDLIREYHDSIKHGFNAMFGHHARRFGNLVVDEMLSRGLSHVPNIFGPIEVRHFNR